MSFLEKLDGYKTKILGYIPFVVTLLALFGVDVDASTLAGLIDQFSGWIVAGAGLYGAAVHWARNQADKY